LTSRRPSGRSASASAPGQSGPSSAADRPRAATDAGARLYLLRTRGVIPYGWITDGVRMKHGEPLEEVGAGGGAGGAGRAP